MTKYLLLFNLIFIYSVLGDYQETKALKQARERIKILKNNKNGTSRSIGFLSNGALENAAELPPEGLGYKMREGNLKKKTNFGSDAMIYGLMELGAYLYESLGEEEENLLLLGDISTVNGGKQVKHINHQKGLDVDILCYCSDPNDKLVISRWISFDHNGVNLQNRYYKAGVMKFDIKRNWFLVQGIFENPYFKDRIRALLLADVLKTLLIKYGEQEMKKSNDEKEKQKIKKTLEDIKKYMRQPKSSPHDNHYHLSLIDGSL